MAGLVEQSRRDVFSPERKASKKEVEYAVKTIGWRDCQNHKCYEINYSENPNYADETGGQKAGTEQIKKKAKKFHYRAVEPQEEGNGRA